MKAGVTGLALVAVLAGIFSFARAKNSLPSDLRDAVGTGVSAQNVSETFDKSLIMSEDAPSKAVPLVTAPIPADCGQQLAELRDDVYREFQIEKMRETSRQIRERATYAEIDELFALSKKFNSIPHDSPEHVDERIDLQNRAKAITRAIVRRAGYTLLNPETGTAFDALIAEKISPDGIPENATEIRSLLIFKDPRPHLAFWMRRNDPAHNPRWIINLGIMEDKDQDYASWLSRDTAQPKRMSGSMQDFLKTFLPPGCR